MKSQIADPIIGLITPQNRNLKLSAAQETQLVEILKKDPEKFRIAIDCCTQSSKIPFKNIVSLMATQVIESDVDLIQQVQSLNRMIGDDAWHHGNPAVIQKIRISLAEILRANDKRIESLDDVNRCQFLLAMFPAKPAYIEDIFLKTAAKLIALKPEKLFEPPRIEDLERLRIAESGREGNRAEIWESVKKSYAELPELHEAERMRIGQLFIDACQWESSAGKRQSEIIDTYDAREPGCLMDIFDAYEEMIKIFPDNKAFLREDNSAAKAFFLCNSIAMKSRNAGKIEEKYCLPAGINGVGIGPDSPTQNRFLTPEEILFLYQECKTCTKEVDEMQQSSAGNSDIFKKPVWYIKTRERNPYHEITADHNPKSTHTIFYFGEREEGVIKSYVSNALNSYYKGVEQIKDPMEKLLFLAETYARIDRFHPMKDGNCRTNLIFLNMELMHMGFPPANLYDPNLAVSQRPEEIVKEIIHGMQRTIEVTKLKTAQFSLEQNSAAAAVNLDERPVEVPRKEFSNPQLINHGQLIGQKTSEANSSSRS